MEEVCIFPVIFKHIYLISWQFSRMSLSTTAVTEVLWHKKQASIRMQSVFFRHSTQLILERSFEVPPTDSKKASNLLQIFSTNTEALTFKYEQVTFEYSLSHLAKNFGFSIKAIFQCPDK
jgi:hypothetical protein